MFSFERYFRTILGLLFISLTYSSSAHSAAMPNVNGTIPFQLKDGEVISADVLNDLFGKVREVVEGFSSPEELVGVWSCTTFTAEPRCEVSGFTPTPKGLLRSKTQNIAFACDATACTWTAAEFWPGSCLSDFTSGRKLSQKYDVTGDIIVSWPPQGDESWQLGGQVHLYKKLNPNTFTWSINGSLPPTAFVKCVKQKLPPAIPSDLTVSVTDRTVTLAWVDNSPNETAFAILRKAGNTGEWIETGTVGANVTTFSDTPGSGDYSYRVLSRNGNGDSLGSNIVVAIVP